MPDRRGRNYTKIRKMEKVRYLATTAHTTTRNCCVNVGSVLPKNFVDVIDSLFHFSFRFIVLLSEQVGTLSKHLVGCPRIKEPVLSSRLNKPAL